MITRAGGGRWAASYPAWLRGARKRPRVRRWDGTFRLVSTHKSSVRIYTTAKSAAHQLADAVEALTVELVVLDSGSEQSFKFIGSRPPCYFGMLFHQLKVLGPPYINCVIKK